MYYAFQYAECPHVCAQFSAFHSKRIMAQITALNIFQQFDLPASLRTVLKCLLASS